MQASTPGRGVAVDKGELRQAAGHLDGLLRARPRHDPRRSRSVKQLRPASEGERALRAARVGRRNGLRRYPPALHGCADPRKRTRPGPRATGTLGVDELVDAARDGGVGWLNAPPQPAARSAITTTDAAHRKGRIVLAARDGLASRRPDLVD
jgi:hypothetical protein